jgi:hypothetical protein
MIFASDPRSPRARAFIFEAPTRNSLARLSSWRAVEQFRERSFNYAINVEREIRQGDEQCRFLATIYLTSVLSRIFF